MNLLIPKYDTLELQNAHVNAPTAGSYASAVSLGGNNGALGGTDQDYGDLTLIIDKDSTVITTSNAGDIGAVYVRSDSANAQVTVNNSGEISLTSTGTVVGHRAVGIMAENFYFGTTTNPGTGKVTVNLKENSAINVSGSNSLYGVLATGRSAEVTTDKGTSITLQDALNTLSMTGIHASDISGNVNLIMAILHLMEQRAPS